ncbi:MAG: lysine--tRNA ligase [Deferribacteraceae bacterium]|jgi:lysyl-tRNA synthetase class 2|nr:lysine--tRNA ligase [Deferribacteraceae bacterium]
MDEHRLHKLARLSELGIPPYINSFKDNTDIAGVIASHSQKSSDELHNEKPECLVAGRIKGVRGFGKIAFVTIKDRTGSIQLYFKSDSLSKEDFELFSLCETGDFIAAGGELFRTKTGELTVWVRKFTFLTKALKDLPEKWHGLKDLEKRHRMRYLDLIMNEDSFNTFRKRSLIVQQLREYFYSKGFLEAETPMMQSIPGGAAAKPFVTYHNALNLELYLRVAPELYLKRLVVGGVERVFELNRNFRNEGISVRHNPEFTMLEWYMAYNDYNGLMEMIEEFFPLIASKVNGKPVGYLDMGEDELVEIDLTPPFARLTLEESILKHTDISDAELKDPSALKNRLARNATGAVPSFSSDWGMGKIKMEIFETFVEHQLIDPTFILGYPKEVSPLAKSSIDDPETTERFELFAGGVEIVNGFNELNDPRDQRERFAEQVKVRGAGDEEAHRMDLDYINALEYGLPPTAGAGIGIDRFVMLICGKRNIREVILFPLLKPEE